MNTGTKHAIHESPIRRMGSVDTEAVKADAREMAATYPSRRREVRVDEQKVCAYSRCESLDGELVTIEQGEVYSINRSEQGILLLMGSRPRSRQLLELHFAETQWEYSQSLYEVQWTKMVAVELHGELFLVGCRLVFEASRHWHSKLDYLG
jgi:hypothetical protein